MTTVRFENALPDLRVVETRDGKTAREGIVHSISGSRNSSGKTLVRTLKVKWSSGATEDYTDGLPPNIEILAWV